MGTGTLCGARLNTMSPGATRVFLSKDILFCPIALAECTSETDGRTDSSLNGNVRCPFLSEN